MRKSEVRSPKSKVGRALVPVSSFLALLLLVSLVLFCQKPLSQPGLVVQDSPADSAVLRTSVVTFTWLAAEQATAYELQVATDSKFNHLSVDDTLEAESETVAVGPDGEYHWRVRPRSADSVWGDWSATWWFNVERFRIVTSEKTQGYPHDICLNGGRVYVADGEAGLGVYDVSNPESPSLLGTKMDSMNIAWGVFAKDSLAYVAYGTKELYITNVALPESIKVVGELEYIQPGFGYGIVVADSLAYIAAGPQFVIINVAQPAYPNLIFQIRYPHDCKSVVLQGLWAFVAVGQLGVAVWKTDTTPPMQVGSFDTPANAQAVAVSGSHLYVADGVGGLIVADISDPLNPHPVATLGLPGYARHVFVADSLVYVSCEAGGLAIVNVAQPAQPVLAAIISLPYTMCAQAEGGYVFAGDRDSGLVVIKIEE